jgi:hypothetical protein
MMKSGTGTLDASWPSDPSLPTAQGHSPSRPRTRTSWISPGPSPHPRWRRCRSARPWAGM